MESTKSALALVISPLTESEFFDEYWEKEPLHISRSDKQHFNRLASLEAIERLLSTQSLQYPAVQLTQSGKTIPISDYSDDSNRILPHRLIEKHYQGATIVISQAHEKIAELADFRRDIQRDCHLRCQTNLYLSPPSQQGFNAHYDSHDVFILQIHGCKTFNFYEGGVELPFQHDSFETTHHEAGALTQSVTLQPGDTLYIPRGVMHDAVAGVPGSVDLAKSNANENTSSIEVQPSSLHITLGVYAITHRDLVLEAIQQLTTDDPAFRKSIPRGWLKNSDTIAKDLEDPASSTLPSTELCKTNFIQALANILDKAAVDSPPNCLGRLSLAADGIPANLPETKSKTLHTGFEFLHTRLLSIERSSTLLRLRTHGSVLEFRDASRLFVELILDGHALTDSRIAKFSDEEKQQVIECLTSANLLKNTDS